jgi:hypothetical protein
MGTRTDQLRGARGIPGDGSLRDMGTDVRAAEILFMDRGPLSRFHAGVSEAGMRQRVRELIAKSILPSLTLDISDNNIPAAVERVADWLEQSGGLYMPD